MDLLQFLASVISSLAWPAVLAYLLFLLRAQLGSLAHRLTELTLPGGTKASFRQELEEAKTAAITIATKPDGGDAPHVEEQALAIEKLDNKKRIAKSFDKVRSFMKNKIDDLPLVERLEPSTFLLSVISRTGIDKDIYSLYDKLRDMDFAAYNAKDNSITDNEVIEYERLCSFLEDRFQVAFKLWRASLETTKAPEAEAPGA